MANTVMGNKIYVDDTGSITTARIKVAYVFLTPASTNDGITLSESENGSPAMVINCDGDKKMVMIDVSRRPMVFNGLFIQDISSGAVATIVTTQGND